MGACSCASHVLPCWCHYSLGLVSSRRADSFVQASTPLPSALRLNSMAAEVGEILSALEFFKQDTVAKLSGEGWNAINAILQHNGIATFDDLQGVEVADVTLPPGVTVNAVQRGLLRRTLARATGSWEVCTPCCQR